METKMLKEKISHLKKKMCEMERILKIIAEISRDKKSPNDKSGDFLSPNEESGDFLSPECLDWSKPWKQIVGPVFKPAKSRWEFEKKYLCRKSGPTKFIQQVIALLMDFPENRNFYVKSKRCYAWKDGKWVRMKPSDFYPALRQKILTHYTRILLSCQKPKIHFFGIRCMKEASLDHWSNQKIEALFS